MRKLLILIFFSLPFFTVIAQEGAPLLTHFTESREIENQNWAICQDADGIMLFANRKGILSFDGTDWLSIRIPTIPFSMMKNPKDERIYVGGDNSYGFLERDDLGVYSYKKISDDSTDLGIITKIIFNDSLVWFYGEQSVSKYNIENKELELRLFSGNDPFSGMFVSPSNTFINVSNKGLFRLDSDTLFPIVTGYLTESVDILFSLPYDNSRVIVGLSDGKISLFDGIKYFDYKINDDGYLAENILSEGIAIGDSLYAFSTLDGGALVISKNGGKIQFTINNQNELPDDEVFAMGLDKSRGLWLSHQFGLTRADLNLPVGNFSIYPGLKGNLTNSLWYNNELYVATSEGVFYLTEVKNYSEVQILVKDEVREQASTAQDQGNRKSILQRIFGRKIGKDEDIGTEKSSSTLALKSSEKPPVKYTRKTVNRLKSINYVFKEVEGLNEKCRQLVSTGSGILAATNKGLYVINKHKAVLTVDNHYINFVSWLPDDGKYWVATGDGYFSILFKNGKWIPEFVDPDFSSPVYSILKSDANTLWLGIDNSALVTNLNSGSDVIKYNEVTIENDFPQRYLLGSVNDSVFLYTESGIFVYDNSTSGFKELLNSNNPFGQSIRYLYPLSNNPWINYGNEWKCLGPSDSTIEKETSLLKIFNDVISIVTGDNVMWVIDGENRLFRVDINKPSVINPESDVFVKSIYDERGKRFSHSDIVLNRGDNVLNFEIVAPGYLKQNTTQYQYKINRLLPDWSPWSVRTTYNLPVPIPGDYTLMIRAKDLWGNIGEPVSVSFTIKTPFTQTTIFYILAGSLCILLIYMVVRFREKQLHKENQILEQKVKERTAEIEAQKEEITSSIEYASRIQMAMLPMDTHFKSVFSDYFILFKPRDIVSGDFYWIGEGENNVLFTVGDCTGHGVPGAFMSTLGISTLNEIIANNDDLEANMMLNLLREKIKNSLHQTGRDGEAADGMDMAFCVMNKNKKKLQFSGAYNPLFVFQDGKFKEYKADRMPIGIYYGKMDSFTNHEISIKKGDTIYIFTDGLSDQFGGPDGSKYKIANLKKLLIKINTLGMAEQKVIIEKEFQKWKGSVEQVDDVTMIGIRI